MKTLTFNIQFPILDPLIKNVLLRWHDSSNRNDYESIIVHTKELLRLKGKPCNGVIESVSMRGPHINIKSPLNITFEIAVENER